MLLDLRTIYVVGSMTLVILGLVQLAIYATGRFERWSLWWGVSNLLIGAGIGLIALRDFVPNFISVEIGNIAILAGYVLMLTSVRVFSGRLVRPHWYAMAIVAGSLFYVLVMNNASAAAGHIIFGSAICCVIDLAIAREGLWIARRDSLRSGLFLAGLFMATALIFFVRAALAFSGQLGGSGLFGAGDGAHVWLAVSAVMFIMMRSMIMLLMGSERNHNELVERAHRDPLTDALNRAGLARSFAPLAARTQSVLAIDIDHFKELNDRHGHNEGDEILRLLSSVARANLRPGDLFARQGGDEFVAVLRDVSPDQAVQVAERIRQAFAEAVAARKLSVHPTISVGVARYLPAESDLDGALQKADAALYRSKRQGRNRVATHFAKPLAA